MPVTSSEFNADPHVTLYTLSNSSGGLVVKVADYGATVVSVLFADRKGVVRDVVLGFDSLDEYQSKVGGLRNPFFGATVGRVANRIRNATFSLNGHAYHLAANNNANSLHGGAEGFDKRFWSLHSKTGHSITLEYLSPDGEENYPGALRVLVTFTVTEANELKLEYSAKLEPGQGGVQTVVNLTNHSYFNLSGAHSAETATILDHVVHINSTQYQEVDSVLIPTGKLLPVAGTPRDFSSHSHPIGERAPSQISGYDLSYILESDPAHFSIHPTALHHNVAQVYAPQTGIKLSVSTTEPALQFYAGHAIAQGLAPKKSQTHDHALKLGPNAGFCLEADRYINAINQPEWTKQVVLSGGEEYVQTTVYKFELASGL